MDHKILIHLYYSMVANDSRICEIPYTSTFSFCHLDRNRTEFVEHCHAIGYVYYFFILCDLCGEISRVAKVNNSIRTLRVQTLQYSLRSSFTWISTDFCKFMMSSYNNKVHNLGLCGNLEMHIVFPRASKCFFTSKPTMKFIGRGMLF